MAQESLLIEDFSGGIARLSEKKDLPNSARMVRGFDVFNEPTALIPFAKTTKDSGSTITDLPLWMADAQPWTTDKYVLGNTGNIYKRDGNGNWTLDRSGTNVSLGSSTSYAYGQGLCVYNDFLYYATNITIGRKGPLDSVSVTFVDDYFNTAVYKLDASQGAAGQVYTIPTSISEASTALCSFVPTKSPIGQVSVNCITKGTGTVTLTLHDANNFNLGSVTIQNTDFTGSGGGMNFGFRNSPPPTVVGNTYHFHLTSSVADTTVSTNVAGDLSTVNFQEYFAVLAPETYHPMANHLNMLVIGNGRYLATWDETTYNPNKIVLPPGWHVRTLAKDQEYLVAGAVFTSAIDGHEEGRLFYWDGIAPTYNYFKETPMGAPNALINSKGRLLGVYGTQGRLYLGSEPFVPMFAMPRLKRDGKMEVAPGAVTNFLGLTAIGYGLNTDDGNVYQGVYLWGSYSTTEGLFSYGTPQGIPEAASLGYQISTGDSQSTSVKIGMLQSFGKDLFIGWQDGSTYGVDKVSKGDAPAQSGSWESLIFDNGNAAHEKVPQKLVMTFQPLTSGDSFTLKYRIDRAANWTLGTAVTAVGATRAELVINQRFHEIEFGFDYTTSSSVYQRVTSMQFLFDDLKEERMER